MRDEDECGWCEGLETVGAEGFDEGFPCPKCWPGMYMVLDPLPETVAEFVAAMRAQREEEPPLTNGSWDAFCDEFIAHPSDPHGGTYCKLPAGHDNDHSAHYPVPVPGAVGACVLNGRQNAEWSAVAHKAIAALRGLVDQYRHPDSGRVIVEAGSSPLDDALIAALAVLGEDCG